ncbi:Zn-ribbon domain-containing OB-fold protein [Actinomadura sp. WMMA1423]|uniref:Zn-ribbon domain-containing OB-fold protein n=1 Tax=Actinomadura sp. WMMA1423 TaxID=2591108 RepID=UPI00114619EC|nr:OB-fold domain-containing protein [Actinomadura sp. WMMA1423]
MDIGILRRDGRTDPFFDGAASDRLVVQRCEACDRWFAPDASSCPGCGEENLAWAEASGAATLVTWTILPKEQPVFLALVELAEGPWLHTRLDGVTRADLREGLPLRAVFEHPDEGESFVLFRPAE